MRTQWLRVEIEPNRVRNDAEKLLETARKSYPGLSFKRPDRIGYYFNRDNEIIGMVTTVWGDVPVRVDILDGNEPLVSYAHSEMILQGERVMRILASSYGCLKCSRSVQVKDLSA